MRFLASAEGWIRFCCVDGVEIERKCKTYSKSMSVLKKRKLVITGTGSTSEASNEERPRMCSSDHSL